MFVCVRGQNYTNGGKCSSSTVLRSIHVATENGNTTSLLPIAICLLSANLSQHIQVWPCPHLTLSGRTAQGGAGGEEKEKEEKIRALTKTAALWANSERGQLKFIAGAKTRNVHKVASE